MRKLAILTVALLAALSAGVLAVTAGSGSSHREYHRRRPSTPPATTPTSMCSWPPTLQGR